MVTSTAIITVMFMSTIMARKKKVALLRQKGRLVVPASARDASYGGLEGAPKRKTREGGRDAPLRDAPHHEVGGYTPTLSINLVFPIFAATSSRTGPSFIDLIDASVSACRASR